ncbi:hypothetical protein TNCV_414701 [Trichonephila clavipes]|nr:hypothetical protein TNCV_414701 [Trichonephila clavipes]
MTHEIHRGKDLEERLSLALSTIQTNKEYPDINLGILIIRGGLVSRSSPSTELNPLDFFISASLKVVVGETPMATMEDHTERIMVTGGFV